MPYKYEESEWEWSQAEFAVNSILINLSSGLIANSMWKTTCIACTACSGVRGSPWWRYPECQDSWAATSAESHDSEISPRTSSNICPYLPESAASHRVENVLEAGWIFAIWQGVDTRTDEVWWILDPEQRRVTPESFTLAYTYFKFKCVAVMFSVVPSNGIKS